MKHFIPTIAILLVSFTSVLGQHKLTRGEVYDFDIGDIFHHRWEYGQGHPPNAKRYTVIDKEYTPGIDTMKYLVYMSEYSTQYGDTFEDLIYTFIEDTISWIYTHLDSMIFDYPDSIPYVDSMVYYTDLMCMDTVYGINFRGFEKNDYVEYGKGLGQTFYENAGIVTDSRYLFYFKKGDRECGTKDVTGIGDSETTYSDIIVFPNPASNNLLVTLLHDQINSVYLLDLAGKTVWMDNVQTNSYWLDLGLIEPGIYILKATTENGEETAKIIIQ